jgi:hypothetical protein
MRTYRNRRYGVELEVPEQWHKRFRLLRPGHGASFYGPQGERLDLTIGPVSPEPTLTETERQLEKYAELFGYQVHTIDRIHIQNKDHVCAVYLMPGRSLVKKYMIVLNEVEYAITALLGNPVLGFERTEEREGLYDQIVSTFRLTR